MGFGLGACLFACIAIFGIVASESYPAHLSGTAHAIAALAANGKYVCNYFTVFFSEFKLLFQLEQYCQGCPAVTLQKFTTGGPFLLFWKS